MTVRHLPYLDASRHATAPSWPWALLGSLIGLSIAVCLFAPASWLAAAIEEASSSRVQLTEPRGTIWSGSARLRLSGGAGSRESAWLPGSLHWYMRPGWRGLDLQVNAGCCTPIPLQGRLFFRDGGVALEVTDGASQWPAAVLAGLGTPWNTVQAEANLQLATSGIVLQRLKGKAVLSGRAELTASALSSQLSTLKPMGSYRVTLIGGNSATIELSTLEGFLHLSGKGDWGGARLRFEGVASTDADHEAALANLLNIIGRRDGLRSFIRLG